jgi:hypothetical protein
MAICDRALRTPGSAAMRVGVQLLVLVALPHRDPQQVVGLAEQPSGLDHVGDVTVDRIYG